MKDEDFVNELLELREMIIQLAERIDATKALLDKIANGLGIDPNG